MVDMDVDIAKPLAGETMECLGAAVCYITIYALDTIHLNYLHYICVYICVYIYIYIYVYVYVYVHVQPLLLPFTYRTLFMKDFCS